MAAYLMFPLLVSALLNGRSWLAWAACGVACAMIAAVARAHGAVDPLRMLNAVDGTELLPLARCLAGFSLGMLAWRLAGLLPPDSFVFSDWFGGALVLSFLALLPTSAPDLALYPLFPMLVLCLFGNRGKVGRVFGCRPVHFLGLVSFSVYLLQGFIIRSFLPLPRRLLPLAGENGAWIITCAGMLTALVAISALTYACVERPGRRIGVAALGIAFSRLRRA